jgi:hypothetical protein
MKTNLLTAGLLGALTLAGCHKRCDEPAPKPETVEVSYAQTYCADQWGQARNPQDLEVVAGAFLRQRGIVPTKLSAAVTYPASLCLACSCKSGVVLTATVLKSDLNAVLALGFEKM